MPTIFAIWMFMRQIYGLKPFVEVPFCLLNGSVVFSTGQIFQLQIIMFPVSMEVVVATLGLTARDFSVLDANFVCCIYNSWGIKTMQYENQIALYNLLVLYRHKLDCVLSPL